MIKALILFLEYDENKTSRVIPVLEQIIERCNNINFTLVHINNRYTKLSWQLLRTEPLIEYLVGGDNSCHEFSGWDKGWEITFLPVWEDDLPYIEEAARRINKQVKIFRKYRSVPDTLRFMESRDVFIGEKLHSVALACCAYTPSIMLEYQPKCRDFMTSLDLYISQLGSSAICGCFGYIIGRL